MAMNRARFRKNLVEGLNAIFGMEYDQYPEQWREIFDVEKSNKAWEEDVLMTGFGGADVKPEGGSVRYDQGQEAWVASYHHETIALAFALTKEADEDGLYGKLGPKYARALARSMRYTKEVKGAAILNNGHSSSYNGGDGVPLFSTSHPLVGGGTLSNRLSTAADLAVASLESALIGTSGLTDDRGIPIMAMGRKLIIPRQLEFVAERLMASSLRPATADNDINAFKSKGSLPDGRVVNHYLTDPADWFIKTDVGDGLKHMVRVAMQRGSEGDFDTDNMRYKARERYSFGWTNWRAAFSSGT